jgi:hypothetical protein
MSSSNFVDLARGTTEPGTFGSIVGDPLYAATVAKFGTYASVSGYAVNVILNIRLVGTTF